LIKSSNSFIRLCFSEIVAVIHTVENNFAFFSWLGTTYRRYAWV